MTTELTVEKEPSSPAMSQPSRSRLDGRGMVGCGIRF